MTSSLQVAIHVSVGRWQKQWLWTNRSYLPEGATRHILVFDFQLIPRPRLKVVRFCERRAASSVDLPTLVDPAVRIEDRVHA
jgi:hypothetical protein